MGQNTEIYTVIIIGILLGLLLVGFIVTILLLYQRRQQRQERELALLKDAYEKEALRSQLEIQENTLRSIAQELHDNIGQMLSVVKLSLSVLPIPADHEAYEPVRHSREVLNKAILDLSNLTKSLHTDRIADIGLVESIRYELYGIRKAGILRVQFSPEGTERSFSDQKAIFLFRMFQETMNNILKHANATEVQVGLRYLDDKFAMEITDNGKGFALPKTGAPGGVSQGVGLRSLYNRASIIGASIDIRSQEGKGTGVFIELPFEEV